MSRRRILFVAENVTLAQVVRLLVLARSLDRGRYDVHFACAGFDETVFGAADFETHDLHTLSQEVVFAALAKGKRLYEKKTLSRYVMDELALFERVQPDFVVGDFRLSLPISAPAAGLPLATLINAYWSPYAVRDAWPIPDHPVVRMVGIEKARRYFPKAMPRVFDHFAAPINSLRKKYGLVPIGSLQEVLTFGDYTVYPDVPELVPTSGLPESHTYLGHVPWEPRAELPAWWSELDPNRPCIYVTLGSSGNVDALPAVLEVLADVPATVLLATANREIADALPGNVRAAAFLPGRVAARRSALVVCNGGASTAYQALSEGVPVVGIASNFDQYLAMDAIERAGAGATVRAQFATAATVRDAIGTVFGSRSHFEAATRVREQFARYDAPARFAALLDRHFAAARPARGLA